MTVHLGVLLTYALLLMTFGLWVGRRVRHSNDFFVAGRRLGPVLLFGTMLAANIGAGSTVSAAGLGYSDGLSAWWWVGSAGLGSIVLAFWVGPRIRRLAAEHGLSTVGDFLEYRYTRSVRATITVLLWIGTPAILAGQFIAMERTLNVMTGLEPWAGCLIGGVVMTVYFTAGGLATSVWVNLVQLSVLLAGFMLAVPLAIGAVGWTRVVETTSATEGYWNFWQGGDSGWLYLAMLGPAFVISPGLLQKVYGARDDRTVRLGVGANAMALMIFAAVPPLLGMIARAAYPSLSDPQLALPTLLFDALPPAIGALGLAALFSAEVSSADAILFMLATSLSQDLYRRFVNPSATDRQVLRVARFAAVGGGALGTVLAIVSGSIVGVLSLFYTLLTVSLFVPVAAGLYLRKLAAPEVLAGIAAGVSSVVILQITTAGEGIARLPLAFLGLAAAVVACTVVAAIRMTRRFGEVS